MNKGFTLIELLVVISIISLLASIVISNLEDMRAKARDSQRISDMNQFRLAFEQAKKDGPFNSFYYFTEGQAGYTLAVDKLVDSGYLPYIPEDPSGQRGTNGYMFLNMTSDYAYAEGDLDRTNTYAIMFGMERDSALGPAGRYCSTSKGIHKRGAHPDATSSIRCVQE